MKWFVITLPSGDQDLIPGPHHFSAYLKACRKYGKGNFEYREATEDEIQRYVLPAGHADLAPAGLSLRRE